MWKHDVTKEIYSLPKLSYFNFARVQLQPTVHKQPRTNPRQQLHKLLTIIRKNYRVVGVTDIIATAKILFDEVIECIHVDVREELAGQAANGKPAFFFR